MKITFIFCRSCCNYHPKIAFEEFCKNKYRVDFFQQHTTSTFSFDADKKIINLYPDWLAFSLFQNTVWFLFVSVPACVTHYTYVVKITAKLSFCFCYFRSWQHRENSRQRKQLDFLFYCSNTNNNHWAKIMYWNHQRFTFNIFQYIILPLSYKWFQHGPHAPLNNILWKIALSILERAIVQPVENGFLCSHSLRKKHFIPLWPFQRVHRTCH